MKLTPRVGRCLSLLTLYLTVYKMDTSVKQTPRFGPWRRACNYISGILNSTSNSPVALHWLSCQISANQREAATKRMQTNIEKHVPSVIMSLLINVISSNQHFTSTFLMQVFKFQRRSCKLSFLYLPHRQSTPKSLLTGYPSSRVDYTDNHCHRTALITHGCTVFQVQTLVEMGFSRLAVLHALATSNNDITVATNILLSQT